MTTIVYVFAYIIMATFLALVVRREWLILEKVLKYTFRFGADVLYELGKTLFLGGVVGIYFIPDEKDFSKAIIFGILFYIIGFATKKD